MTPVTLTIEPRSQHVNQFKVLSMVTISENFKAIVIKVWHRHGWLNADSHSGERGKPSKSRCPPLPKGRGEWGGNPNLRVDYKNALHKKYMTLK